MEIAERSRQLIEFYEKLSPRKQVMLRDSVLSPTQTHAIELNQMQITRFNAQLSRIPAHL